MDAYKAIVTKRDTRSYTDDSIPNEVLNRVIQAGRMAGSSKNTQPIRLVIIRDREWLEVATCGSSQSRCGAGGNRRLRGADGSDFDA
jgi:hypothetical protein